jgi:hypothetical protein
MSSARGRRSSAVESLGGLWCDVSGHLSGRRLDRPRMRRARLPGLGERRRATALLRSTQALGAAALAGRFWGCPRVPDLLEVLPTVGVRSVLHWRIVAATRCIGRRGCPPIQQGPDAVDAALHGMDAGQECRGVLHVLRRHEATLVPRRGHIGSARGSDLRIGLRALKAERG